MTLTGLMGLFLLLSLVITLLGVVRKVTKLAIIGCVLLTLGMFGVRALVFLINMM